MDFAARAKARREARRHWCPWFAWRPVRLVTGEWAWLETVHRTKYVGSDLPAAVPFSFPGAWCFRREP